MQAYNGFDGGGERPVGGVARVAAVNYPEFRKGICMKKAYVTNGIDRLGIVDRLLVGRRVGLMTNQTGVNRDLESTIDILKSLYDLRALFAVEHGLRGDIQAGGEVKDEIDPITGLPVYSAYGKNRKMSREMRDAFDVLVFDIQDVGLRFYTYIYSLSFAMQACAETGKPIIVLDRINPLGGKTAGIVLDRRIRSFVGAYELPTRYGLTIGEYAEYVKDYLKLDLDLTVVRVAGWKRSMLLDETDLPWVPTSPNCPSLETALCYAGTCIFEGTNVSEGRGTTVPFQMIGAPWINGRELEMRMAEQETPGIRFKQASFRPTFSKFEGETCSGVQMYFLDRDLGEPVSAGLMLLDTIRKMYPDRFRFIKWPGSKRYPIDTLLGTGTYRCGTVSVEDILRRGCEKVRLFEKRTAKFRFYE